MTPRYEEWVPEPFIKRTIWKTPTDVVEHLKNDHRASSDKSKSKLIYNSVVEDRELSQMYYEFILSCLKTPGELTSYLYDSERHMLYRIPVHVWRGKNRGVELECGRFDQDGLLDNGAPWPIPEAARASAIIFIWPEYMRWFINSRKLLSRFRGDIPEEWVEAKTRGKVTDEDLKSWFKALPPEELDKTNALLLVDAIINLNGPVAKNQFERVRKELGLSRRPGPRSKKTRYR